MKNLFASGTLALAMAISGSAIAEEHKAENAPTIRTMSGATATRDLATWDNKVVDHKVLQQSALTGVADVFAEIKTTDAVLALPVH